MSKEIKGQCSHCGRIYDWPSYLKDWPRYLKAQEETTLREKEQKND